MPMKYVHMSTSNNCSKPEMAAVMPTNHSPLQIYRDTTREVSVGSTDASAIHQRGQQ
jgi:hypothetical protein